MRLISRQIARSLPNREFELQKQKKKEEPRGSSFLTLIAGLNAGQQWGQLPSPDRLCRCCHQALRRVVGVTLRG